MPKMIYKYAFVAITVLFITPLRMTAQGFELLNYPLSAQSFSAGGIKSSNPNLAGEVGVNAALATGVKGLSFSSYGMQHIADISGFSSMIIIPLENHYLSGELLLINYGLFDYKDEYGNIDGSFGYYELAGIAGYAYKITPKISAGTKLISYQRRADNIVENDMFLSTGVLYRTNSDTLTLGFSIDNIPLSESDEPSPQVFRMGLSKQLAHLPLRVNIDGVYEENSDYHIELGGNIYLAERLTVNIGLSSYRFDYQTGVAKDDVLAGLSFGLSYLLKQTHIHWGIKSYASIGAVTQAGLSRTF